MPARNLSFPASDFVSWQDVAPRLGLAYDVFGNGRTAFKVALNKYMVATGIGTGSIFGNNGNPIVKLANVTTRALNDTNRNYVPDCDLINPDANGECGVMANRSFGHPTSGTVYDPDTMTGWGKRPFNWEFSAGVQYLLFQRVSLNVGYFDRWYGNQVVTDNRAVTAADFDRFSIPAPGDARLPGGGYTIGNLYNLQPAKVGLVDPYLTFSKNFGRDSERWRGTDISVDTRFRNILLQGGVSAGRTSTDNCELREKLPEIAPVNPYCNVSEKLQTQVKFIGSYTIPRVDVQTSAAFQSFPGPAVVADFVATNPVIQPSLGRPLSGGALNVPVNLIETGSLFGERTTQLDLRFAKLLRFGRSRSTVSLDVYNAFNANAVLQEATAYGRYREPVQILQARFARISLQFDF